MALPPNNRKGSGYTNINRVVTANQGNKLGQTVSSGVQNQATQVKDQTQKATTNFNQEAQKNRLDTEEAANKRDQIIGRFSSPNETTTQRVTDEEVKDFSKYRVGTYEGPKQLQDYQTLAGRAQNTEMLGDLSRSTGGRQELLKRFVGGSGYTQGQQNLDNLLLGQSGNYLNDARRSTQGLSKDVSGANTLASNLAQEYVNRAKMFGDETVQKLGTAKSPISTGLDTKVSDLQTLENNRLAALKDLQDVLVGDNSDFKPLDKMARLGIALQSAADQGIISQGDINMLLGSGGKTGLIQRGANLGLDLNALVNERFKNQIAENLARTGVASESDIAKLNSLDRLGGKQGTDLEFLDSQGKYKAGKTSLDISSLEDYIRKMEAQKAGTNADYAKQLSLDEMNYLNQALAYGNKTFGDGMQAVDAFGIPLAVGAASNLGGAALLGEQMSLGGAASAAAPGAVMGMLALDALQGKDTTAQGTQAAIDAGLSGAGTMAQANNAIIEGLLKLNIGGNSLSNTEAGKQLSKALAYVSENQNKALQGASNVAKEWTSGVGGLTKDGIQDILKGNVGNLVDNYLGAVGIKSAGNIASNVGKAVSSAVKKITGGGIKISDEDLKTDIDYDRKHIDDFLEKLKPAAYNYKDEVKNSPLASDKPQLGVMAQDLEKSKLGKESVIDTEEGKVVDYDDLQPKMLAALAQLKIDMDDLKKKK